MSINTYPKKTLNELFGLEGQYVWPDDIDVIPEDAEVSNNNYGGYGGWNKGIPCTEDAKKKISKSRQGIVAWNKGLPSTEQPFYGKTQSEYQKKKCSETHKGKVLSEKTKKNMSESAKKRTAPNGMLGRKHSEETKKKMSENNWKRRLNK